MGLFGNVRKIVDGYREMAHAQQAEADRVPLTIRNPTPQAEVDRLIAAGGVARGVVVRATHNETSGERVANMAVNITCRARLANGELGEPAKIKVRTSWQVAALLDPGLEIPVTFDRVTGVVTDVVTDQLRHELAPRFDESKKRRPGWTSDIF